MIKEYTNTELINYLNSASLCLRQAKGVTGFVLKHNYQAIYTKIQPYMELRNQVIMKYGELAEDGEYHIIDEEQLAKANAELKDYDDLTMSVDIIKLPEEKTVDSNLTAAQLMALTWMIKSNDADTIRAILGIEDEDEEDTSTTANSYDPREPVDDPRFT